MLYEFRGHSEMITHAFPVLGMIIGELPDLVFKLSNFGRAGIQAAGDNYIEATTTSFAEDTDVEWRPRLPQWPAVGDTMATAIQASLVGQAKPADALNEAQKKIEGILKG